MAVDEDFKRILETHGAALGRVCTLYARARGDEEDLRQEVAFALWRALPSFRGACSERTFALRIAHNLGQKHALGFRNHVALDEATLPPAGGADPERSTEARRDWARLVAAMKRLRLEDRQILGLSLEGLPQTEIGEVVGMERNAVAVRLHRARVRLREALDGAAPETENT